MKRVIIIGAGGHAAELRDYINHSNHARPDSQIQVEGFIDDSKDNYDHYGFPEPYLGTISKFEVRNDVAYLIGIANLAYRRIILEKFIESGAEFVSLIHPTALISPSSEIGKGVVISHNASVGPKVKIGDFNILNSRCTIGHDSILGDYNFISPQVAISGNTIIGNENMFGTNACTIPGMRIGDRNKIGAGMVVFKNVENDSVIFHRFKEKITVLTKEKE